MTTTYIGTTFPKTFQWHIDEVTLINNIKNQINAKYPNTQNLFINTTWFGPQFNNGQFEKLIELTKQKKQFDNLFMLAAADPIFLNSNQIKGRHYKWKRCLDQRNTDLQNIMHKPME